MRASPLPSRRHLVSLAAAALTAFVACSGSDSGSSTFQINPQRAQLTLPAGDALGGDALGGDALGGDFDASGPFNDALAGDGEAGPDDSFKGPYDALAGDAATPGDAPGDDTGISVDSLGAASDAATSDGTAADAQADDASGPGDATAASDSSSSASDSTATASDTTASASDTASDSSTTAGDTAVLDDTATTADTALPQAPGLQVEWCRLWYPAVIQSTASRATAVFAHVSVPGLTDQTPVAPDPAPWLLAQIGWGPVGAIPGHDPTRFAWIDATPDPNPPADLFWRHDRYVAQLTIETPGTWDYVARFSADYGASWLYCDLDGSQNGYLPGEAGRATIAE